MNLRRGWNDGAGQGDLHARLSAIEKAPKAVDT